MEKTIYQAPSCETLEFSIEKNFCTSGESVGRVTGYYWDDDDE